MKMFLYIIGALSILMLASLTLCGLWIRNANLKDAELASAVSFHANLGIASVIVSIVTIVLFLVYVSK